MYIKLYEQWLNENQTTTPNFTQIISKYMDVNNNKMIDRSLNELAQHGALSNDIRIAIKENKVKYSDGLWNNISTPSGVESAINVFKMMFNKMLDRKEPSSYRSKFEEAMFDAIGNDRVTYNFSEKILNSKKVVDLMNSIVKGNKAYADEIGFYFAMFDVACAITNGIYYVSSQIPISMKYANEEGIKFNNLREAFDSKNNKFVKFKDITQKAESLFQKSVQSSRVGYMTPGQGRTISYSVPITDYYLQIDTFKDYVNNFSLSSVQKEAETWLNDSYNSNTLFVPGYIFGILYIGNYYNQIGKSIIERSTSFMQEGGASWYQKLLG